MQVLKIHNLYFQNVLNELYKIINYDNPPEYLRSIFVASEINSTRLVTPMAGYKTYSSNFMFTSVRLWNMLASKKFFAELPKTQTAFKSKVKRLLTMFQNSGDPTVWSIENTNFVDFASNINTCQLFR